MRQRCSRKKRAEEGTDKSSQHGSSPLNHLAVEGDATTKGRIKSHITSLKFIHERREAHAPSLSFLFTLNRLVFCFCTDAPHASKNMLPFVLDRLEIRLKCASAGNIIMTAQQFFHVAHGFAFLTNVACSCHRIFLL